MDKVTKNYTPRKHVTISALSFVGCKARALAILEGERRFCGNKTEVIRSWLPCHNVQDRKAFYASRSEDCMRCPSEQECVHGGEEGPEGDLY
jgi:hypothetical protein